MMLVKGTVLQSSSIPGTQARCMTLPPLPRVCPGRGRLAFTSGSTDPKFIACMRKTTPSTCFLTGWLLEAVTWAFRMQSTLSAHTALWSSQQAAIQSLGPPLEAKKSSG